MKDMRELINLFEGSSKSGGMGIGGTSTGGGRGDGIFFNAATLTEIVRRHLEAGVKVLTEYAGTTKWAQNAQMQCPHSFNQAIPRIETVGYYNSLVDKKGHGYDFVLFGGMLSYNDGLSVAIACKRSDASWDTAVITDDGGKHEADVIIFRVVIVGPYWPKTVANLIAEYMHDFIEAGHGGDSNNIREKW